MTLVKQCCRCKELGQGPKPLSEFNKNRTSRDGFQDKCRKHTREYSREWAKKNPERNRIKGLRFRKNNPEASRAIAVRTSLKQKYGLSEIEYAGLFKKQHGKCAICSLPLVSQLDKTRVISKGQGHAPNNFARVDHCHATGQVRGLLCFSCNVGLGKFQDDEKLFLKAVGYLRKHRNPIDEKTDEPREGLRLDSADISGPRSSPCCERQHWLN